MAVTVDQLVDRVRDDLDDYGEVDDTPLTILNGAINSSVAAVIVDDESVADVGDWLYIDFECLEITAVTAATKTFTCNRGARGSTAASHADNAVVRVNLAFPAHRIIRALNIALSHAYPELHVLTWDVSLVIVEGQQFYVLPATIDQVRSFWMETSVGSGNYEICRLFELEANGRILAYDGGFEAGAKIGLRGISRFSALASTPASALDTNYPEDEEALSYLTMYAMGDLLIRKSGSDAAKSVDSAQWETSGQGDRYVSMNHGRQLKKEAEAMLQSIKMPLPARVDPRPDRRYYGAPVTTT